MIRVILDRHNLIELALARSAPESSRPCSTANSSLAPSQHQCRQCERRRRGRPALREGAAPELRPEVSDLPRGRSRPNSVSVPPLPDEQVPPISPIVPRENKEGRPHPPAPWRRREPATLLHALFSASHVLWQCAGRARTYRRLQAPPSAVHAGHGPHLANIECLCSISENALLLHFTST